MQPNVLGAPAHPKPETSSTSYESNAAILAGAALLATTLSAQTTTPPPVTDVDILNYLLKLERLEASFYTEGLKRFTPTDFSNAAFSANLGNPAGLFGDSVTSDSFVYLFLVRDQNQTHVQTLIRSVNSLSGTPSPACTYTFNYTTVDDFLTIAKTIADAVVSGYVGAMRSISSPSLLTAAATAMTTEARHAAYLHLIAGDNPFPNAFEPAKSMADTLTVANGYTTACLTA